jgi:hypothetical protein
VAVREKEETGEGAGPTEVNGSEEEVGLQGRRAGLMGWAERRGREVWGFSFFQNLFFF